MLALSSWRFRFRLIIIVTCHWLIHVNVIIISLQISMNVNTTMADASMNVRTRWAVICVDVMMVTLRTLWTQKNVWISMNVLRGYLLALAVLILQEGMEQAVV